MRPSRDPRHTLLHQVPGLGTLSDAELDRISALVEECELPEGTVLVREGTVGQDTYVIVEGWAAVSVGGDVIAALGPGDHVGEMAILDHQPRSATVTAKAAMRVLVIGPEAMGAFLDHPGVVRAIAAGLARRLRVTGSVSAETKGGQVLDARRSTKGGRENDQD